MTSPRLVSLGRTVRASVSAGIAFVLAMTMTAAWSQTPDALKRKGTLTVGVQADFPPWGSTDVSGALVGYDIDVAKMMAADLEIKLNMVPVTAANRIAYLTTGKVDILIAAIGMYPERAKAVQFSKPYATLDTVVFGRKTDAIKSLSDLQKLRVGVSRGGAGDVAISRDAPSGTVILRFEDDAVPVQALLSGQVDVLGSTNLMGPVISRSPGGERFEQKFAIARQYNGLAIRLGERELNVWLNAFVDRKIANGQLNAIAERWTGAALINMPDELNGVPFRAP